MPRKLTKTNSSEQIALNFAFAQCSTWFCYRETKGQDWLRSRRYEAQLRFFLDTFSKIIDYMALLVKEMEEEKQENFQKQKELVKEVLKRANKKERQEYSEISDKQNAIMDRMQKMQSEQENLSERNRKNEYPKTVDTKYTLKSPEELTSMTSEESRLWGEQVDREIKENRRKTEDWTEKFDKWLAENTAINSKQWELIEENIGMIFEMFVLEKKEKWLLLSIALRSQPNLLKYLQ